MNSNKFLASLLNNICECVLSCKHEERAQIYCRENVKENNFNGQSFEKFQKQVSENIFVVMFEINSECEEVDSGKILKLKLYIQ